jgi:hypothetical protein
MTAILAQRLLTAGGIAALGFALSGCLAGTTYGTGTTPGKQTIRDIAGIVALGGNDRPPIDFSARPPIVAPPSTAALPPPKDPAPAVADANWPNDPDANAKAKLAASADTPLSPDWQRANAKDSQFRLPPQPADTKPFHMKDRNEMAQEAIGNPAQDAAAKKLFADARRSQNGSVDANGAPVRRFLTEPPATYREPDPTAPTEIIDKPKAKPKFKWGWPWASN